MALSTVAFWEQFYCQHTDLREWYVPNEVAMEVLLPIVTSGDTLLHIGCGSSETTSELLKQRELFVHSIDFSESVIEQMSRREEKLKTGEKFYVADVQDMSIFEDSKFDTIIDKVILLLLVLLLVLMF